MSISPPIRRYPSANSRQEDLINAYEAEEERILNLLSRKLEQLREENIRLENTLEAESESHVNRLSRELTALRLAQHQQQQHHPPSQAQSGSGYASLSASPETRMGMRYVMSGNQANPCNDALLDALKRENAQLRNRLVETEQAYTRISRTNELYREELIDHRRRLGIPLGTLIGMTTSDPFSQPTHHRSFSPTRPISPVNYHHTTTNAASTSSFSSSARPLPGGVPIPRTSSQIYRPVNQTNSETGTPFSHSPPSSEASFLFSPTPSITPASYTSSGTALTSPGTSASVNSNAPITFGINVNTRTLTYPSVPPPSLSSSFGSPSFSLSPVEPLSRRNSNARRGSFDWRPSTSLAGEASVVRGSGQSRRASVERGARIAETGTLVPRSRAGSQSFLTTLGALDSLEPPVVEDADAFPEEAEVLDKPSPFATHRR